MLGAVSAPTPAQAPGLLGLDQARHPDHYASSPQSVMPDHSRIIEFAGCTQACRRRSVFLARGDRGRLSRPVPSSRRLERIGSHLSFISVLWPERSRC